MTKNDIDLTEDQHDKSAEEKAREAEDIPTGRFSRFVKLSALSAGASTRYFGQRVRGMFQNSEARAESMMKTHMKTAQKTVEVMGQLKGAVMKVGQMVSLHPDGGVLSPELTQVFNRLQNQAPTLAFPAIAEQIKKELQGHPAELYAWFDEAPMAAASLGQVHAAKLRSGEDVVVKIQYPGIDKTVESDLWQIRNIFKASGFLGRTQEFELIFKEIRDRLTEELDYEREARNIEQFRDFFKEDQRVLIPRYVPELSSKRILTMERMYGKSLDEVMEQHEDQDWRNKLGQDLYELLLTQMFEFRNLHADPQLGNFRFMDDGRLIMLDLGCVKEFEKPFMTLYIESIEAGISGDSEWMARVLADMGILEPGHPEALELVLEFAHLILRPLIESPYCFADNGKLFHELKSLGPRFLAYPEVQGHPDMVYMHRTYAGFYFIMTRLSAIGDWREIFHQVRDRARARWEREKAIDTQ